MSVPTFDAAGTVTLHQRTVSGQNASGQDVYTSTDVDVAGCAWWPRLGRGITGGAENAIDGGDRVVNGLTLLMPAGTVVNAVDRVTVAGLLYEVDGDSNAWNSPLTGLDLGVQVALVRHTG